MSASNNNNNLQSLSISSCINDIVSFFNSQDNNSSWKSLTTTSEGSFLIRLLGTVVSNLSYKIVSYVREAFLSTCNLLSSAIGISVNLGYSVNRGSNQQRIITARATDAIVIPRYSVIGTYNSDYDIINVEDITLAENEQADIKTIIGNIKTVQQTAGTAGLKIFSFYTQNISEDLILLKDGVEIPFSKNPANMANDMYWVRTNPYSSIDISYFNTASGAQYKYSPGTVFTVKYIELADVPTTPYTNGMFTYFDLVNTKIINLFIPMETVNSIKITAPYSHTTQNLIRAKEDYVKSISDIDTSIIASDYNVIVPTYAEVSYLKNDYSLLTETSSANDSELTIVLTSFDDSSFLATPLPDIVPSKRELITLRIGLKYVSKPPNLSDVNSDIKNLLVSNYYGRLNNKFSNYDLEALITESLDYVRNARVNIVVNSRSNSTHYNIGDYIQLNNIYYKATSILGKSGNSEPSWVLPNLSTNIPKQIDLTLSEIITPTGKVIVRDTTLETVDNTLVWRAYKKLNLESIQISTWSPNKSYKIGDYVCSPNYVGYMFKAIDLVKFNGSTQPTTFIDNSVLDIGTFITDGNILWVSLLPNGSDAPWTPNTSYRLGNRIQVGNFSYECIGYIGQSDTTQPVFELDSYTISQQGSNYFKLSGNHAKYFSANDVLQVYISSGLFYSFSVSATNGVSYDSVTNTTTVNVNQPVNQPYTHLLKRHIGTNDGNVFWEIVDDITVYSSSWKVFNTINFSIPTL